MTKRQWVPITMTALDYYNASERGDYCEILYLDGDRRQVKIAGAMLLAGDERPVMLIATRGAVTYRLRATDRVTILVRR